MYYKSPMLANQLIMNAARRSGTPSNETGIIAQNAASQLADTANIEAANQGLDLGRARLNENARQFNENVGLQKSQLNYAKDTGNIATALSGVGLGVSTLNNIAANKRFQERLQAKNDMVSKLKKIGDSNSMFFADFLNTLNLYGG